MNQETLMNLLKEAKSILYAMSARKCNADCSTRKKEAFEVAEKIREALKEWDASPLNG